MILSSYRIEKHRDRTKTKTKSYIQKKSNLERQRQRDEEEVVEVEEEVDRQIRQNTTLYEVNEHKIMKRIENKNTKSISKWKIKMIVIFCLFNFCTHTKNSKNFTSRS